MTWFSINGFIDIELKWSINRCHILWKITFMVVPGERWVGSQFLGLSEKKLINIYIFPFCCTKISVKSRILIYGRKFGHFFTNCLDKRYTTRIQARKRKVNATTHTQHWIQKLYSMFLKNSSHIQFWNNKQNKISVNW